MLVLPGEDPAEWESFHAGVAADFAPVGVAEVEQANWIVSLPWRRRRVILFEVAAAVGPPDPLPDTLPRLGWAHTRDVKVHQGVLEMAERTLADARRQLALHGRLAGEDAAGRLAASDALFLLETAAWRVAWSRRRPSSPESVPATVAAPAFLAEVHADPERWDGWTVGVVLAGLELLAVDTGESVNQLLRERWRSSGSRWSGRAGDPPSHSTTIPEGGVSVAKALLVIDLQNDLLPRRRVPPVEHERCSPGRRTARRGTKRIGRPSHFAAAVRLGMNRFTTVHDGRTIPCVTNVTSAVR